jgi:hypothetical protein
VTVKISGYRVKLETAGFISSINDLALKIEAENGLVFQSEILKNAEK